MIQITPQHHLHIRIEPIDFRKGIDALVGLCRQSIGSPYSGTVFAFRNKSGIASMVFFLTLFRCFGRLDFAHDFYRGIIITKGYPIAASVKLLVYDGTGFWLCTKRFSQGKLRYWPTSCDERVCATTMAVILNQGTPAAMSPAWRSLPSSA